LGLQIVHLVTIRFLAVDYQAGIGGQACTDTSRLGNFRAYYDSSLGTKILLVNFFILKKAKAKRRDWRIGNNN